MHQRPQRAQLNPGLGARLGLTPPPPGPELGAFVLGDPRSIGLGVQRQGCPAGL